jgi:hypothetical protein
MVLTPDQEARIRANRERALALQKSRKEQKEKEDKKDSKEQEQNSKRQKLKEQNDHVELEEFEEHASEFATKTEAMKMYCLPEGGILIVFFDCVVFLIDFSQLFCLGFYRNFGGVSVHGKGKPSS